MTNKEISIRVGVLTVSDSRFQGSGHVEKGTYLKHTLTSTAGFKCDVVGFDVVPDDVEQIKAKLMLWSDYLKLDLILTTGGTGFTVRDVTPEATKAVIEKEAPGMSLAILNGSLQITPLAMLSRLVVGIRNQSLLINLPGNPYGAVECFQLVCPVIPRAVNQLRGTAVKTHTMELEAEKLKEHRQTKGKTGSNPLVTSGISFPFNINKKASPPPGSDSMAQVENTKLEEAQVDGGSEITMEIKPMPTKVQDIRFLTMADHGSSDIKVGILTASDSCFIGTARDKSGENLKQMIEGGASIKGSVVAKDILPDEMDQIKAKLMLWSDYLKLDLILTTGGTGFAARDVTPEATKAVIQKEATGLSLAMMKGSLDVTPFAMLTRLVCGIRNKTLIMNLPGSTKGAAECFLFACPAIPHAVDLLRGHKRGVEKTHAKLQAEAILHPHHHPHEHLAFYESGTVSVTDAKQDCNTILSFPQQSESTSAASIAPKKHLNNFVDNEVLDEVDHCKHSKHIPQLESDHCIVKNSSSKSAPVFCKQRQNTCSLACHVHSKRPQLPQASSQNSKYDVNPSSKISKLSGREFFGISRFRNSLYQHLSRTKPLIPYFHPCSKHQHLKPSHDYITHSRHSTAVLPRSKSCLLWKRCLKSDAGKQFHKLLPPFKLLSPSREIYVLSRAEEERSEAVEVEDDIEPKLVLTEGDSRHTSLETAASVKSYPFCTTCSERCSADTDRIMAYIARRSSIAQPDVQPNQLQNKTAETLTVQSQCPSQSYFSSKTDETILAVKQSFAKQVTSEAPKASSIKIKTAKIYNCRHGGEVAYPSVGDSLRKFLENHPLIQGIPLHKGKREIKRNLVKLCLQSNISTDTSVPLSLESQRPVGLDPENVSTCCAGRDTPEPSESLHDTVVCTSSGEEKSTGVEAEAVTCKSPPKKWNRGKYLLERNNLEDCFTLTEEGERLLCEVKAGRARDRYVVNWYMWCPGQTNCRHKCGGYGRCITGCPGMQHKQDRHRCGLMVNLKLFLSDLLHWRVHITGSHVPPGDAVQWIPPATATSSLSTHSSSVSLKRTRRKAKHTRPLLEPALNKTWIQDLQNFSSSVDAGLSGNSAVDVVSDNSKKVPPSLPAESNEGHCSGAESLSFTTLQNSSEISQTANCGPMDDIISTNFAVGSHCTKVSDNTKITVYSPGSYCGVQFLHKTSITNKDSSSKMGCITSAASSYGISKNVTHDNETSVCSSNTRDALSLSVKHPPIFSPVKQSKNTERMGCSQQSPHEHLSPKSLTTSGIGASYSVEVVPPQGIPSKKRISKMLSKLKRHRLRRGNHQRNASSETNVKVETRKPSIFAVKTFNIDLNKLDTTCINSMLSSPRVRKNNIWKLAAISTCQASQSELVDSNSDFVQSSHSEKLPTVSENEKMKSVLPKILSVPSNRGCISQGSINQNCLSESPTIPKWTLLAQNHCREVCFQSTVDTSTVNLNLANASYSSPTVTYMTLGSAPVTSSVHDMVDRNLVGDTLPSHLAMLPTDTSYIQVSSQHQLADSSLLQHRKDQQLRNDGLLSNLQFCQPDDFDSQVSHLGVSGPSYQHFQRKSACFSSEHPQDIPHQSIPKHCTETNAAGLHKEINTCAYNSPLYQAYTSSSSNLESKLDTHSSQHGLFSSVSQTPGKQFVFSQFPLSDPHTQDSMTDSILVSLGGDYEQEPSSHGQPNYLEQYSKQFSEVQLSYQEPTLEGIPAYCEKDSEVVSAHFNRILEAMPTCPRQTSQVLSAHPEQNSEMPSTYPVQASELLPTYSEQTSKVLPSYLEQTSNMLPIHTDYNSEVLPSYEEAATLLAAQLNLPN